MYKRFFVVAFFCLMFAGPSRAETLEVVTFSVQQGVSDKQLLAAAEQMEQVLRGWSGFRARELVNLGQGQWLDVLYWSDMKAALKAEQRAQKCAQCRLFFSKINEASIIMQRGEIALSNR